MDKLREALAAQEHERWSSWMRWLFNQSTSNEDGTVTIPASLVQRWERQMWTPYADLTEHEKDSDRIEVDKTLHILGKPGR